MECPGNASGNATCNAASTPIRRPHPEPRLGAPDQTREHVHGVCKRQDIIGPGRILELDGDGQTPEQHELLSEIIHRQTTPSAPPLRVSFIRTGLSRQYVRPLTCQGPLYNRLQQHQQPPPPTTRSSSAGARSRAVAVGGNHGARGFQALRKTTGPNKDGGRSASELNTFRVAFRNVKCVIVDELLYRVRRLPRDSAPMSDPSSARDDHVPRTTPEMSASGSVGQGPHSATAPWQEPLDGPPLGPGTSHQDRMSCPGFVLFFPRFLPSCRATCPQPVVFSSVLNW
ncbi:hypothetical protein HPB48_005780 [Haemaphysalis longicornis]|uniref:Uncharacterized protein n=1 Tax=Haemaphysalis longicornis TaxID=44386 RepID=A0A9J6GGL9_HAELO|nr:hypothetical protein HPB48_005780 [Haemaphysalis longicornis]